METASNYLGGAYHHRREIFIGNGDSLKLLGGAYHNAHADGRDVCDIPHMREILIGNGDSLKLLGGAYHQCSC